MRPLPTLWMTSGLAGATLLVAAMFAGCGGGGDRTFTPSADAGADAFGNGDGATTGAAVKSNYPCAGCAPFPAMDAPECAGAQKLPQSTIAYPPDGVLLPPNLNVLEVQFKKAGTADLFEIDFVNDKTEVRVETRCKPVDNVRGKPSLGCGFEIPLKAWKDVADANRGGDPVRVTIRATADKKCVSTSKARNVLFAEEDLKGGVYYWQSGEYGGQPGRTGGIFSHDFGDPKAKPTPFYTSGAQGTCVGCHTLSRDGERISLGIDDPDADDEFGDVSTQALDVKTRTVLGSSVPAGFQTWSHDHKRLLTSTFAYGGTSGDHAFDVYDDSASGKIGSLALTNVQGTQPDLAPDDTRLVFVSPSPGSIDPYGDDHFTKGTLYAANVDLAGMKISDVSPILTPVGNENFYYPSFSPDGRFLVFNHAPSGDAFYNPNATVEIAETPESGPAHRIALDALNDGDGLTNSWPRWSPFVQSYKGKKLYWVTFSSNRDYGYHVLNGNVPNCYPPESPAADQPQIGYDANALDNCAQPQIWAAAIVVDESGAIDRDPSFAAFWLPSQDVESHNHSAQWVEKIVAKPDGDDAGTCGKDGDTCSPTATCCSDFVCCNGKCAVTCIK